MCVFVSFDVAERLGALHGRPMSRFSSGLFEQSRHLFFRAIR